MDSYFRARDILDKAMGTDSYFQIKSILFGLKAADVVEVRHARWIKHEGYDECEACHAFQSTPPVRGATSVLSVRLCAHGISIHAPREGGDRPLFRREVFQGISIHAPREGGDLLALSTVLPHMPFQSTPPVRGATPQARHPPPRDPDFNPRPP